MSDTPQGPGWWQASDGKYYPPEQAPGAQPTQPASQGYAQPYGGQGGGVGLDVGSALRFGWNGFTTHAGTFLVLILCVFAANLAISLLFQFVIAKAVGGIFGFFLTVAGSAIGMIVAFILSKGLIKAGLDLCDGVKPSPGAVFNFEDIGPYAVAAILAGLATFVGYIFCIIPGIIIAIMLFFWPFAVVDEGKQPTDALKESFDIVKNRASEVLVFLIACFGLNLLGALLCGIGLLFTWPTTLIAAAYAWRVLRGRPPVVQA